MSEDLRILVLEDQPADAELMLRAVRKEGIACSALRVETEADFRTQLLTFRPALILADYRLPSWDGMSALALAQSECPDVPFIFVSGSLGEERAVESLLHGATDYVVKERLTRLGAAVRRALREVGRRNAQRRMEEQLRDSETRYRRLFETAVDGLLVFDAETGMVMDVNPFLLRMLGFSHGDFVFGKIWELRSFRDVIADPAAVAEFRKANHARPEEVALEASDGRRIEVELVSNVYLVNDRTMIQCTFRDITERKREEEELHTLRKAVDSSGEVIFLTDRDGVFTFVNAEFTRLYGYTAAEVVGKATPRVLKGGTVAPESYESFWKALLSKRPLKGELTNKTKDGALLSIETSTNTILDAHENILGFLAIQRDVTARKQLEAQLQHAQKMESVGRLAGGVAHDFNNMLTVILGRAELAMLQMNPSQPFRVHVLEIEEAARRSANLSRQLLAFARRQNIMPRVLDLNENVSDSLRMLKRLIGENIQLLWQPAAALWCIRMDPSQLDQVLANLCVNARDAIADVGTLTIATANCSLDAAFCASHAGAEPGEYVRITASDTGCGMDTETLARIFDPFFTTKAVGKGTGLGLSTVYGAVRQNGGCITVISEPGRGTTFEIYLPRYLGTDAPIDASMAEAPIPRGEETLLLVEDEPVVLDLATVMLETLGYRVLCANGPGAALRLAEEHAGEIDLLLTDVIMPEMNGHELSTRVGLLQPRIRHLFMSGYSAEVTGAPGVLDHETPCLAKPFTLASLATAVRNALDPTKGGS